MLDRVSAEKSLQNGLFWIIIPLLLFCFAFFLRTSGLSHDLHLGNIYHPDSPKQIRAVERFMDDRFSNQYYRYWNDRDLDGYPYFNSHIVEHVFRGYATVRSAVLQHLGVSEHGYKPDVFSIYWVTRLLNSCFSALAVVLLYSMGRRHFGLAAGVMAALWYAVSPVDITTSNYAMSDSTAAFFVLLSVFFALRIAESPRIGLYVFGALAAACAFSAKYHGIFALVPMGLAHYAAFPRPRSWISRDFWIYGGIFLAVFTAGVFLTTPSLLVYTAGAWRDILGFLEYTSGFGMTEEMRALPLWSRFILAMRINLPLLNDYTGLVPLCAAAVGMVWLRRNTYFWLVCSLPIFFILVGLTMKPLSHPDYFTIALPFIFLAGAAVISKLWHSSLATTPLRIASIVMFGYALTYLGNYTWNEVFFFRHNDTRRVAETWALDTFPRPFQVVAGPYTFDSSHWDNDDMQTPVTVFALSGRTGQDPDNTHRLHEFSFEQDKLSRNRNWDIRFLLQEPNNFISSFFSIPVMPRFPASRRDNMIQADAPALLRSARVLEVGHLERVEAVVTSAEPLARCAIFLHNADYPAEVHLRFGGRSRQVVLQPHERKALVLDAPRSISLTRNTNHFYALDIQSRFNMQPVRITLAATNLEIAREMHLAGEHEQAYDFFVSARKSGPNISEKMAMAASGLAAGALDEQGVANILDTPRDWGSSIQEALDSLASSVDDDWFFREFGVHPQVFSWLSRDDEPYSPIRVVQDQIRTLQALIEPPSTADGLPKSLWSLFLMRGDNLAADGQFAQAFAFYKTALALHEQQRSIFEALEKLVPVLPEQEAELHQLLQPYRQDKERVVPLNVRFANGLEITGFQANSVHLQTDQHLEVRLLWKIPELRPDLYALEYHAQLVNVDTGAVIHTGRHHFVRSTLVLPDFGSYRTPSTIFAFFNEQHTPGRYALRVSLNIAAQNRVVPIRSPRHARKNDQAVITEIVLHDP